MSRLFLVALVAAVSSGWSAAQVPAHLSHVPPDAAVFVNVSVAKLWKGPLGEQLRSAKVAEFDRAVADFEAVTGLTPADVTSATAYWPDLRTPSGGIDPFVVTLTLTKPLDAGRLVALAAVGCLASGDTMTYRFEKGVLTLKYPTFESGRRGQARELREVTLDMSDALRPRLTVHGLAKARAKAEATGPQTPALVAAATRDFVVGVNAATLPPAWYARTAKEAEAQPFVTLLKADFALVAGQATAGEFTVEARFNIDEPADRADGVKSLGALRTLFSELLAAGLRSASQSQDAKDKPLAEVLAGLKAAVGAAKTRLDGPDAVATLTVPTDLPYGPALVAAVGKNSLDARDRALAANHLKQLGLALHNSHDANNGFPPPAFADAKGKPLLSWRVAVLPFLEQDALYKKFKLDEAWDSEHNAKVFKDNPMPAVFAMPGVTPAGGKETHFRVFVGNGAAFEPLKRMRLVDFTDGTSNTLLVVTAAKAVPWTKPEELEFDPEATANELKKLLHMVGGGCNVLFADGSARFVPSAIDGEKLKAVITRGNGEVIGLD